MDGTKVALILTALGLGAGLVYVVTRPPEALIPPTTPPIVPEDEEIIDAT